MVVSITFIFVSNFVFSQLVYDNPGKRIQVTHQISYLIDYDNELTIDDILLSKKKFIQSNKKVLNFGISDNTIWLNFEIINKTNEDILVLDISKPIIDQVEVFIFDNQYQLISNETLGENEIFKKRNFLVPDYLFEINVEQNESRYIFIRLRAKENLQTPIFIGSQRAIFNFHNKKSILSGIYMGIMLVMILYNLFIYFIFRDNTYIKYCFYIIAILLTQTSLQNYTFQFLWPNVPKLAIYSPFLLPAIVGMLGLEFFKSFLRLKTDFKKYYRYSLYFIPPYIISVFLGFIGYYSISFKMVEATAASVSIFMFYVTYKVYRSGFRPAIFFLIGWSVFLVGIIVYVLKDFEILPYNNFTRYTMHIGSAIEVILFSFALADRINILRKEKEQSQELALKASQENAELIQKQNIILEQKVRERTQELEKAKENLENTLSQLKNTQSQLVESEKMASLGQLTAGIAHEINNPINFVSSNIYPLKLDINDIYSIIEEYDKLKENADTNEVLRNVENLKKEIDFEFVKKEVNQLLKGIEDGAQRTFEIVKGLKNFSYLDEAEKKLANLNDGLKSTLILLRNTMGEHIKLTTEYGEIPPIECFPGKMNQVFMNVLSNAIQAIQSKEKLENEELKVKTYHKDEFVIIEIKDSGPGMSESVKSKIFEPFFTTKEVGKGTGLGLSIVYNIINKHDGKIEVESKIGEGTLFRFLIPIKK